MNDKISLLGLLFYGHHGVLPEEKKVGQRFEVEVHLSGDFTEAAQKDDLAKSVDYSKVYEETKKIMEGESFNLLEALAHRVCQAILQKFERVEEVTVRVRKPNVPIPGVLKAAAVEMTRRRSPNP